MESSVTLYFVVRPNGSVKENILVQRTAGFGDFDENARAALRAWRFEPLKGGRTGEQWGTITFHFRLRERRIEEDSMPSLQEFATRAGLAFVGVAALGAFSPSGVSDAQAATPTRPPVSEAAVKQAVPKPAGAATHGAENRGGGRHRDDSAGRRGTHRLPQSDR